MPTFVANAPARYDATRRVSGRTQEAPAAAGAQCTTSDGTTWSSLQKVRHRDRSLTADSARIPQHAIACVPLGRAVHGLVIGDFRLARNTTSDLQHGTIRTGQFDRNRLIQPGRQEGKEIVRAACKAGEGRDGLTVRIDYRIERQSNRSKALLLHL